MTAMLSLGQMASNFTQVSKKMTGCGSSRQTCVGPYTLLLRCITLRHNIANPPAYAIRKLSQRGTMKLTSPYQEESSLMDIPSYRFVLPYRALQANTTFNLGFCMEVERDEADWNQCAVPDPSDPEVLNLTACNLGSRSCPDGLLDITRCMERAPVALSSPYFYQGAEFLRDDFKDFPAPNRTQHETSIHVEPNSGVAMEIARRIQVLG